MSRARNHVHRGCRTSAQPRPPGAPSRPAVNSIQDPAQVQHRDPNAFQPDNSRRPPEAAQQVRTQERLKRQTPRSKGPFRLVAGAGFEPA
jgi:hypothetical protein